MSWNCTIAEDELFACKVGSDTETLSDLVERSLSDSPVSSEASDSTLEENVAIPIAYSPSPNVQVVECAAAAGFAAKYRLAPKILKKKSAVKLNGICKMRNLKKVTFEVEKMVAAEALSGTEREGAAARIALSLGAAPPKGVALPYKQLKAQRTQEKEAAASPSNYDILKPFKKRGKGKKKPRAE